MAALSSAVLPLAQLAVSTRNARADQRADAASAALAEQQATQTAANSIQQITTARQSAEQQRLAGLRRAVAKRQAALAGQGISAADGGSGEALLLGLVRESDDEGAADRASDSLQIDAIRTQLEQTRQRNLLELSQAAQKRNQRLQSLLGW